MVFNSHEYIFLFLPGTFIIYLLLNRACPTVAAKIWLIICSFVFCCWNEMTSGLVLACSILFTYCVGCSITGRPQSATTRKAFLAIGIAGVLASLCFYKYTAFAIENLNQWFKLNIAGNDTFLPVGISFFTFTEIAYLIDLYRDPTKRTTFQDYVLFISFFPRLLAGPITRYDDLIPQLNSLRKEMLNYRNLSLALYLFCIGLFKKVVIADHFGDWASSGFDQAGSLNLLFAWATSLSYTFQIYFDFSGYTDMAIGAALFFNIKLPINFNSPYKAVDIQDFWRRWHITLTGFLRDYIYIPLGGNRVAQPRLYFNLMVVFLIGGIWHGAGWTFIFWGFLHGAALIAHHAWRRTGLQLPRVIAWIVTFNFVNIAWIFFRAKTWGDAVRVLKGMVGLTGISLPVEFKGPLRSFAEYGIHFESWKHIMEGSRDSWWLIFAALAICLFLNNSNQMADTFKPGWKWLVVLTAGVYSTLNATAIQEFVYQFF